MKYKTIDLCAGIGGIRKGFELTKYYENVLSAEIDPYAAKTYEHLYGEIPMKDITTETFMTTVCNINYDVLLAGFPCQTFSRVGKRLGFRDITKGTIFFSIADIVANTDPKAIFLENVENLVSHDNGRTIKIIINTLEHELGYRVIGVNIDGGGICQYSKKSFVRNSRNFGIPQNRPRAFIMAFSKKWYGDAVKVLNSELPWNANRTIFKNVMDILEPVVDDHYYMSEGYLETLKKHKQRQKEKGYGFGYCIVNRKTDLTANTILATGGSGKERNLVYQPKEGVSGKVIKSKKTPLNKEGIRVMTPTEWGRLQGFIGYAFVENGIDKFSFPKGLADAQKYKQFGNSVTIPVVETMANFMIDCFKQMTEYQKGKILVLAKNKGAITQKECEKVLKIPSQQVAVLLHDMVLKHDIYRIKEKKSYKYYLESSRKKYGSSDTRTASS